MDITWRYSYVLEWQTQHMNKILFFLAILLHRGFKSCIRLGRSKDEVFSVLSSTPNRRGVNGVDKREKIPFPREIPPCLLAFGDGISGSMICRHFTSWMSSFFRCSGIHLAVSTSLPKLQASHINGLPPAPRCNLCPNGMWFVRFVNSRLVVIFAWLLWSMAERLHCWTGCEWIGGKHWQNLKAMMHDWGAADRMSPSLAITYLYLDLLKGLRKKTQQFRM